MRDKTTLEVVYELMKDLEDLRKMLDVLGPTPFVIRSYSRTLFSILEAWAYHTKWKAFVRGSTRSTTFSKRELEVIHEERTTAAPDGKRITQTKRVPTSDNLRVAVRVWSKVHGGEKPPLGGELPPRFLDAQAFRNRITHPKVKSDLSIAKDNLADATEVLSWFGEVMSWQSRLEVTAIDETKTSIKARGDELRKRILAAGPATPFQRTIEELYTPPTLPK